jgi:hypothetical protein
MDKYTHMYLYIYLSIYKWLNTYIHMTEYVYIQLYVYMIFASIEMGANSGLSKFLLVYVI